MTWRLVSECCVNPASRNRHGEKAQDLVPVGSNEYRLLQWLEGLLNHPPDLGPGASRADTSLAQRDWFYHRNDTPHRQHNIDKRADGFLCPLCRETSGDCIALFRAGTGCVPGAVQRCVSATCTTAPSAERRSRTASRRTRSPTSTRCTRASAWRSGAEVPLRGGPSARRSLCVEVNTSELVPAGMAMNPLHYRVQYKRYSKGWRPTPQGPEQWTCRRTWARSSGSSGATWHGWIEARRRDV